ncbi:hypothetical protein An04g09430 [Aspergillus niger]|uniref:Uncharacterized protein n=2 Tax=Aspergillus niger TaxID=5061 RepID=A2QK56_ASPNC|nr:hypothetical protein An04g09430 [Aspergillus niger]CAK39028.1 hypothetical protein An04g09430 [Aspergillus niger]
MSACDDYRRRCSSWLIGPPVHLTWPTTAGLQAKHLMSSEHV